jgi:hypothetical protein
LAITQTWTSPAEGGSLDLGTGATVTATVWENLMSDVNRLGGANGALLTTDGGIVFVNDDANAKMTQGVTINQGANDNEALALKSSDVAHGITDYTETDTYGAISKVVADTGGLKLGGFSEGETALQVDAFYTTDDTGKTTAADGAVVLQALKKSGTAFGSPGADANLLVIKSGNSTTRFIFDAEGTFHADVGSTTFDDYDDVALLDHFDAALTADPLKTGFGQFLHQYREELQAAKIANFEGAEEGHAMVNFTRLAFLLVGACRQLGRQKADLETRLGRIEARLALLPGGA